VRAGAALLLVACVGCSGSRGDAVLVAREVCGSAFADEVDRSGDTIYAGCTWKRTGRGRAQERARLGRTRDGGALESLEVSLSGGSETEPAMRRRVTALVAPLLDDAGDAAVERALRELGTNESRLETVGSVAIGTAVLMPRTTLPWERYVSVEVWFVPAAAEKPLSLTPRPGFATVSPATLDAWGKDCRDDAWAGSLVGGRAKQGDPSPTDGGEPAYETRWATGDHWLRCQVLADGQPGMAVVTGVWKAATRELTDLQIVGEPAAQRAILERWLQPLLDEAGTTQLRAWVVEDPRGDYGPMMIRADDKIVEISGGYPP
jgi:hypothetical protein